MFDDCGYWCIKRDNKDLVSLFNRNKLVCCVTASQFTQNGFRVIYVLLGNHNICHIICDMWHTYIYITIKKGYFGTGANIRSGQEIPCLWYYARGLILDPGHKWTKCSTPPGSSLLYIGNLRNPSCWSESEYFYRHT